MIPIWLLGWASGVSVFLGPIAIASVVSEHRRLRARRTPRPAFVIWRRILGAFGLDRGVFPPNLAGHQAWLKWDIRWLAGGETLANVVGESGGSLELQLHDPIVVAGSKHQSLIFVPRTSGRVSYGRASVRGTLRPEIEPGLYATGELVVYPASTS